MRSNVTLFGHPIHPMLIAFPVAFYTATVGCLIMFAIVGDPFWARAAELSNGIALIAATAAALPGVLDYFTVVPRHGKARRTARIHAGANVLALVLFAVCYALLATRGDGWLEGSLVLSSIGLASTLLAGFHGWSLVQDHHIGVHERPYVEAAGAEAMPGTIIGAPPVPGGYATRDELERDRPSAPP